MRVPDNSAEGTFCGVPHHETRADSHSLNGTESVPFSRQMRWIMIAICAVVGPSAFGQDDVSTVDSADEPEKQLFTGSVVFLEDALTERGLETYTETGRHVVLKTDDGELLPILADWRGRAFYQDEKLRDRKVELIGFYREQLPYLNVLAIYTFNEEGHRQFTDYWCDICAFPMYMIQPCECCQGDVRLRFQTQELPDYVRGAGGDAEKNDADGGQ